MKAKNLISKGKVNDAIPLIEESLRKHNLPTNDLLLVKSQLSDLDQKVLTGQISGDRADTQRAKIKKALFDIIDSIDPIDVQNPSVEFVKRKLPILFVVGACVVGSLLLSYFLFAQLTANKPGYNESQEVVVEVDKEANNEEVNRIISEDFGLDIYPEYRDLYLHNLDANKKEVRSGSKDIIKKLELIGDDKIDEHVAIYKYIGLALCNKVLALTSSDDNQGAKIKYADNVLEALASAENLIVELDHLDDEEYKKVVQDWLIDQEHHNRIKIFKFIASTIKLKAGGSISQERVKEQLLALEEDSVLDDGYQLYPIVKWARNNLN